MNFVIDARWIGEAPSGIGVYTRELARRLPALAPSDHFTLVFRTEALREREVAAMGLERAPNVDAEVFPHGVFSLASQLILPTWLRIRRCDVFHSPNFMIPYMAFSGWRKTSAGRCIATIHDVIPLILPDHAPKSRKSRMMPLLRASLRATVRQSHAVLTVSETSRRDIVAAMKLGSADAAKLHAIHNGISVAPSAGAAHAAAAHAAATGAGEAARAPVVMYVGRLDPYKRVAELVRAFASVARHGSRNAQLIIVGPDDPRYPEARNMAKSLNVADRVSFLGFLPQKELDALYGEATVVVNPSRYEGFGLPILEAMARGVPVICGDGGAQPEVAGDAARIVPSDDGQALADAISEVLSNPSLRAELSAKGLARAAQFSWDRTAARTLDAYRVVGMKGAVLHRITKSRKNAT